MFPLIHPALVTVGELLGSGYKFVVPKYQRGYSWDKSQADELFADLQSDTELGLFLGTLIFDVSGSRKRITIVDGQQRLTTLFLLLIACRIRAKELNNETLAQETYRCISSVEKATAKSLGPFLQASDTIREVFEHIAQSQWDEQFPEKLGKKNVKRQVRRLKPVYESFKRVISEYDQDHLSTILEGIYGARAIRIEIEYDEEAFSIFERTNARGLELEVADLLKNYLHQQDTPDIEIKWPIILENSSGTLLRMLRYFYISKHGNFRRPDLYKNLKAYGKNVGPETLLEEMCTFSRFYSAFQKEEAIDVLRKYFLSIDCTEISGDNNILGNLHSSLQGLRLFKVAQIYPLMRSALECYLRTNSSRARNDAKKFVRFVRNLEAYHFINNAVCDRIGNEVERLYADCCGYFVASSEFQNVSNTLTAELRTRLAKKEEFLSRFSDITYSVGTVGLINYIFDRFNNCGLEPGEWSPIFEPLEDIKKRNYNIEHILPLVPKGGGAGFVDGQDIVDNIGNLLVLPVRANSGLGNLSPADKISKLKGALAPKVHNFPLAVQFIQGYEAQTPGWGRNGHTQ